MARIQDAVKNIAVVVANTRMTQQEHKQLEQDIVLVVQRCERADELEKRFKKELEAINKSKKKDKPK